MLFSEPKFNLTLEMKKNIFYYSEKKMKYIEIKKFYVKFLSLITMLSIAIALIIFGVYTVATNYLYPNESVSQLKEENKKLEKKYIEMASQLTYLNEQIEALSSKDNDLRLSVNLEPISDEDRKIGIGGSEFSEVIPTSVSDVKEIVSEIDNSLDVLKSKIILEQNNYLEIEKSLDKNVKLFKSIPAIIPAQGNIGDRFGMRLHPILRIRRMHTGLDIIVNTGTKVYAPGDGKVIKVGRRGGYGLVIEIDHGFGYTSLYAHLSKTKVKKGQHVKRGDVIALSGKSGSLATGPHLHYEVKHNGIHLNPYNFIFSDIKIFDYISAKGSS